MCLQVLCCCETAALKQDQSVIVPNHERSVSFCPDFLCNDFNSLFSPKEASGTFYSLALSEGLTAGCNVYLIREVCSNTRAPFIHSLIRPV